MERGRTLLVMGGRLTRGAGDAGATEGGAAADGGAFENAGANGAEGMTVREGVAAGNGAWVTEDPLSGD